MRHRRHRRWGIATLAIACLLVADGLGVGPASAAASATSPLAVGAVTDITWGTTRGEVDRTVSALATAGVEWVRANVNWKGGEPTQGRLNETYFADIDYAVARAQAAGIKVLMPIGDGVPYWASADPAKWKDSGGEHWNQYWRPKRFADYARFVGTVVGRYADRGVHHYELWNEPNLLRFWPSGPDAAEYKTMLAAAYPAVKAADPSATVVLGGLSKSDYRYLAALYKAKAAPYFDVVAIHPYTGSVGPRPCWQDEATGRNAIDAFCAIAEVRRTMQAHDDERTPLWLTEFGWSTSSGGYGVSEQAQGEFLSEALVELERSYPYVAAAFWYNLRDTASDPADYESNLGLLRRDFSPKPAYGALREVAAQDTKPPAIVRVRAVDILAGSARVRWTTDESATSRVNYWIRGRSGTRKNASVAGLIREHRVKLTRLRPRTVYEYRVVSADAAGNVAKSKVQSFVTAR